MFQIITAESAKHYAVAGTLFVEYADQLGHDLCFQDFARELETLPGAYAPPSGRLLLARDGERWLGCVALRRIDDATCELKRLYVRPAARRLGLGHRLTEEVIAAAREIGYRRMRLDTLANMTPARTLYEALGFREIPPYYHNPIDGAVYYELDLRQA